MRVTVALIRVPADATMRWQQPLESPLTGVFQVQAEIASRVAQSVGVAIGAGEQRRLAQQSTRDSAAFVLYLQGRHLWNRRTASSLPQSVAFFTRAIRRDSNYARPTRPSPIPTYSSPLYEARSPAEAYPRAKQARAGSGALDSVIGQAHAVLAGVLDSYQWDWKRAEEEYLRAIALSPSGATAHQWFAEFLSAHGRMPRRWPRWNGRGRWIPCLSSSRPTSGDLLYRSRRFEAAIATLRAVIEMDPYFEYAYTLLGISSLMAGHDDQAVSAIESAVRLADRREWLGELVYVYARTGRKQAAAEAMGDSSLLPGGSTSRLMHLPSRTSDLETRIKRSHCSNKPPIGTSERSPTVSWSNPFSTHCETIPASTDYSAVSASPCRKAANECRCHPSPCPALKPRVGGSSPAPRTITIATGAKDSWGNTVVTPAVNGINTAGLSRAEMCQAGRFRRYRCARCTCRSTGMCRRSDQVGTKVCTLTLRLPQTLNNPAVLESFVAEWRRTDTVARAKHE